MKQVFACALIASLAGCATTGTRTENVVLVAPEQGAELVSQCSRQSVEGAKGFYTPTTREITRVETATMRTLRDARADHADYIAQEGGRPTPFDWPDDPSQYQRQYVGYVLDGRRMIYGNYFPRGTGNNTPQPLIICDGGPVFFGAEYDIEADRIVRIAFNGGLGGPFLDPIEP